VIIFGNRLAGTASRNKHKCNYGKQYKQGYINDCLGLFDGFHDFHNCNILMTGVLSKGWKIIKKSLARQARVLF